MLDLGLLHVLADSWLVCLPSQVGGLLSTGSESELVEGTHDYGKKQVRLTHWVFCLSFTTLCWAAECGWSHMQMNGGETSNVAGNQHKQWTTTYFIQCHPPWSGSCQELVCSDNQLHTQTLEREKDRQTEGDRQTRDCLEVRAFLKKWILLYRYGLFFAYKANTTAYGLFCVRQTCGFGVVVCSPYLPPLMS